MKKKRVGILIFLILLIGFSIVFYKENFMSYQYPDENVRHEGT